MGERQPAHLSYLVIFNPTLRPLTPTDDDDDIEQASILLYTARSRAVSRDTMLRQVGLAKALINFSELFTPEAGCDNVHSQKKRMIMFSPEANYWVHACVQLPSVKRQPSRAPKSSAKGKGKASTSIPPADILDYVDNTTYDDVLRASLRASYEGFHLLHGSFEEIRQTRGVAALEGMLEQYFNVWAWKWELDAPLDLPAHLGVPLHPRHQRLKPIFEELLEDLPSTSSSFIVQHEPPALLTSPPHFISPSYRALVHHILYSLPPPTRSPMLPGQSHDTLPSSHSSATLMAPPDRPSSPTPPINGLPQAAPSPSPSPSPAPRPMSQFGSTMAAPFTHAGTYLKPTLDVVNPAKWSWPGYLTVRKSPSRDTLKELEPPETPHDDGEFKAHVASVKRAKVATTDDGTDLPEPETPAPIPNHDIDTLDTKEDDDADIPASSEPPSHISSSAQSLNEGTSVDQDALEDAMLDTTPPQSEADWDRYPPLPPSPPPPPPFVELRVRISLPDDPSTTEERTVLHVHNHGLTFAVLMPRNESSFDPDAYIDERVDQTLRTIRGALDNPSMTDLLQPVSSAPSRAVLLDESTSTTSVVSTTPYKGEPHLFAASESFQRHPWLHEIISRSTVNQWYASRRSTAAPASSSSALESSPPTPSDSRTARVAFLEAGNAQASLVDVDSELSALIRQTAW